MAKKKTRRRTSKSKKLELPHEMIDTKTEDILEAPTFSSPRKPNFLWIGVIVLGMAGLLWINKGMIVAAVLNGRPIFRWELNNVLTNRFGKQTLEGMISERLIAGEAAKAGIRVTASDIDTKEAELTKNFAGDMKLEDMLALQGLTKEDFDNQVRLQLTVERILSADLNLSETDIDNYIATNRALLAATDAAGLRAEARAAIINQKVSERVQTWFMDLKDKAKILRFL